ncbi:hypothetical protein JBP901_gp184 [Bacillus phage JBP901]|uniref:Uncharacterized protein n=1 Tax=Bacillus phage JBP901 TaxID=1498212 RepID=A0A0E3DF64_9CAUD|nr:hypothetical protein JBP901_gp184 [Bacillus phage JBP901]AID17896.1 hypothetical protein JBP901_gp184 [Bacillus phage JBP901]
MTHVFTERMAILKKMDYLEKERALLLAEYNSCFDRLRELDEIDRMSDEADHVAQVMKEAYAPEPTKKKVVAVRTPEHTLSDEDIERISVRIGSMFAKTEGEPKIEEIVPPEVVDRVINAEQKITDDDIITTKSLAPDVEDLLLPEVPVHKEGQSLQEYFEENKEVLTETVEVKEDKPKEEPKKQVVGEAHKNLQMKPSLMRGTTNDNRIVAQFAKVILKDFGSPIKAKRLIEKLRDTGLVLKSPYETLKQIMQYEPGIQRVGHGFYQYVPVSSKSL